MSVLFRFAVLMARVYFWLNSLGFSDGGKSQDVPFEHHKPRAVHAHRELPKGVHTDCYRLVKHNTQHTNERPLNQPSIEIIEWHITQLAMKRLRNWSNNIRINNYIRINYSNRPVSKPKQSSKYIKPSHPLESNRPKTTPLKQNRNEHSPTTRQARVH